MSKEKGRSVTVFCVQPLNALQPKIARTAPVVENIGFVTSHSWGECTPQGTVGCLSKRVLEKTYYRALAR